jgi:phosphoribosylamine--glycine ligase
MIKGVTVFHAGTVQQPQTPGRYLTSGGRVLGVTGLGSNINDAIGKAYQAVSKITFEGMQYRRDIGAKAI